MEEDTVSTAETSTATPSMSSDNERLLTAMKAQAMKETEQAKQRASAHSPGTLAHVLSKALAKPKLNKQATNLLPGHFAIRELMVV